MPKALMNTQPQDPVPEEAEKPSQDLAVPPNTRVDAPAAPESRGLIRRLKSAFRGRPDTSLRETIAEYIEESGNAAQDMTSAAAHERALLSNILKLRDNRVVDVMIPRADIFAVDAAISQDELLNLLSRIQHSRIPVYRDTLDNILGVIHIKDILACLSDNRPLDITSILRDVLIVSPAMHVLDLLLMMKQMKKHLALVVDEYGGIDGLVTINDVIESIVGTIEDEYDTTEEPQLVRNRDGSVLADGRLDVEEFESLFGTLLNDEERAEVDTLGGLVFFMAGRVPARGEILPHESGMVFEIVDADPRRVKRLLIKNIPTPVPPPAV